MAGPQRVKTKGDHVDIHDLCGVGKYIIIFNGWAPGGLTMFQKYMSNANWTWCLFYLLGDGHKGGRVELGGIESECDWTSL